MFSVTKRVLAEFDKLYAIAGVVDQGHFKTCYAASEGREERFTTVETPISPIITGSTEMIMTSMWRWQASVRIRRAVRIR